MKSKTKKILITLSIILLIILIGFSIVFAATDIRETVEDTNKTSAVLNDKYVLPYKARDTAKYNNLYCVWHTQGFDNNLTNKTNVRLIARAMVEIKGEHATFYKIETDEKTKAEVIYAGETDAYENNIMAGIVTDKNIKTAGGITVYKGYGALIKVKESGWGMFDPSYTITTVAVHTYYNTWRDTIKGFENPGFKADEVYWEGITNAKKTAATDYINQIEALGETYSARIYFLQVKCAEFASWPPYQNTILVEPIPTIDVPVAKVWEDTSDTSNRKEIAVKLLANGEDTGKTLKLNAENEWKGKFTELDITDESGNKIVYTVEEVAITGYNSKITGDQEKGFTITNTLQTTDVSVTKSWEDYGNTRPTAIKVTLCENGTETNKTVVLNEENEWKYTFKDLPKFKNGQEVKYTVKETELPENYTSSIVEDAKNKYTITNKGEMHGYIEITGKVWLDGVGGKANEINGVLDSADKGISGIKVILRDNTGKQFDVTSTAITNKDGIYTIKVNYDNSKKVYKLYQNAETVVTKLKTAYIEFEYDGLKYTTVANVNNTDANKASSADRSKAIENETLRNAFDNAHSIVTSSTPNPNDWTDNVGIASTKNVISFENYEDKKQERIKVVVEYCKGNGTHIRTNSEGEWLEPQTVKNTTTNHAETCQGKEHNLKTHEINKEIIQNVNLGLFEKEQPDVAIFSDISKVKVTIKGQEYTYLYNVRSNEKNNVGLKVKFEQKDTYTYKRPVNPADIAYINKTDSNAMAVEVTYQVTLANLSTTLPVTIHNIDNYYDSRYTLKTTGWEQKVGTDFNTATNNEDLNITLAPGTESEKIELTYTVSLEAIKGLLNEDVTLNNAVEIQSYSTKYGEKTVYAEQQTGGRTGNPYGGYDYDSHPGNAGIALKEDSNGIKRLYSTDKNGNIISAKDLEDDTDIAPSLLLCKDEDYYKILSGNVWEDSDVNENDKYRLGDGKKSATDKNVENVKVELYKVKEDGTLEIAQLYYLNTETAEVQSKDAIAYTDSNGNYAFGDKEYGVVTDKYVIKFTYGDGIEGSTINARDYKSTIISPENINVYNLFKGISVSEEWHLNTSKGYSIAVDNIEERAAISDLQYNNFGEKLNITAWGKPFTMQVEFDPSPAKTSSVDVDGKTVWPNELNIFDFGIIERAREDIFVETTIEYLKITLANGQKLVEGDPRIDKLNYTKSMGFGQNINSGTAARNALEKQVLIEIDAELLQGSELEIKYALKVTNNSEKDIDYYIEGETPEYKTEYYYFGTNNEGSPEVSGSVNYVVDYFDKKLNYTWENANEWTQIKAQDLYDEGLISRETYKTIKKEGYVAYITDRFSGLKPGESKEDHITTKKLLANNDKNIYDNHAEILKIDAKTARTIKQSGVAKEYKMGNYIPSFATRQINTDINREEEGLHEQDDDRLKVVITPPTGATNNITIYIITSLIGLIIIGIVVMFIKKKVLIK